MATARKYPLRKPKGFEPAVQRWSVALPRACDGYLVSVLGIQAATFAAIEADGFAEGLDALMREADGPIAHDHARHIDDEGQATHVVTAYWIDRARRDAWEATAAVAAFWSRRAAGAQACGYFKERLDVPADRQESIYWQDYPASLSKSEAVAFYPTPYCGYYGAMRDRLPIAATDSLASALGQLPAPALRTTRGRRLRVQAPANLAVIRSAVAWGDCDEGQLADFRANLREPLEGGMSYLRQNAQAAGCCSLRYQTTVDATGTPSPESHALGYFLSLPHLEEWAERHPSHHAIFSAAIARYRKYGPSNQLRTWHEVYVLPDGGQSFEYMNCSPGTGLLPWFEGKEVG